ncbi:hypothetical protein [Echinimonas agarilytica]|uniref:Lipoprotein n=1 Tax=Echinimonas agarilytica TaxID=1215918 RepID=A0AA41W7L7_9GAMM|nr:hypothetical protein [Echinimonas agarilytica]MCM2680206.1 hypothetical protein [Echinimonas agarilytica]
MEYLNGLLATFIALGLSACGTTDSTLESEGKTAAYIQGFHDGRHSGLKEEGNDFEHYIRDEQRFSADSDYKLGWLAGESEGKSLQDQAATIGNAMAGAYSPSSSNTTSDADKVARDVLKKTDTSGLGSLEE